MSKRYITSSTNLKSENILSITLLYANVTYWILNVYMFLSIRVKHIIII